MNCNEVCISPINPPSSFEIELDSIETKIIALLCLFYNTNPLKLSNLQLCSMIYVKPNFLFKSSCKKYTLILPNIYAFCINQRIAKIIKCESKSCYKTVNKISFRTFCRHSKNVLFEEDYISELIDTVKCKSENDDTEFCRIYDDPKSYVRPFDNDRISQPSTLNSCPAYFAIRKGSTVPSRIKDSEITLMTLSNEHFNKFYQLNKLEERNNSARYMAYNKEFKVKLDSRRNQNC